MMLTRWRSNPISFIETVLYDPRPRSHSSSCQPNAPFSSTRSSATTMAAFCTRSRFIRVPRSPARRRLREFTH